MKKYLYPILTFTLALTLFAACEETKTESEYANWRQRNDLYIDSLKQIVGNNYVTNLEQVAAIPVGTLFAIPVVEAGTTLNQYYVYCKKIAPDKPFGERPFYTSQVTTYYHGTTIDGNVFDGNFNGYSATDRGTLTPDDADKAPTAYDTPGTFSVSTLISGWKSALQLMHAGERWMLYIPYQCAYGTQDQTDPVYDANGTQIGSRITVPAYSLLAFDVLLESIQE
jgi:FKBP-type peptidyl-prolyl cis-trans isomerase FklB